MILLIFLKPTFPSVDGVFKIFSACWRFDVDVLFLLFLPASSAIALTCSCASLRYIDKTGLWRFPSHG